MTRQLKVEGLPADIKSVRLKYFFENKKRDGGPIENIELNTESRSAVITFQNSDAVHRIVSNGDSLQIMNTTISVSALEDKNLNKSADENPNTSSDSSDGEDADSKQIAVSNSGRCTSTVARQLKVEGLPADIKSDRLKYFFENKKRDGGPIETIELNTESRSAVITFQNSDAVHRIVSNGDSLQIMNTTISVSSLEDKNLNKSADENPNTSSDSSDGEDADSKQIAVSNSGRCTSTVARQLKVEGLPADIKSDRLKYFFQNKKRGGGPIENIELNTESRSAVITFQNSDAVHRIVSNGDSLQIMNTTISVSALEDKNLNKSADENPNTSSDSSHGEDADSKQIAVSNSETGDMCTKEDESANKDAPKYEKGKPSKHERESCFNKVRTPGKTKSSEDESPDRHLTKNTTNENPDSFALSSLQKDKKECTVKVKVIGRTQKKDNYIMHLEDGELKAYEFNDNTMILDGLNHCVYVTYSSKKDAEAVCQFDHRNEDDDIECVEIASETDLQFTHDMISVHGLDFTQSENREKLCEFVKKEVDVSSADILLGEESRSAIIKFPDKDLNIISNATWKCAKELDGILLTTAPVPMSPSIFVSADPMPKDKMLKKYFSNANRSHGGRCNVESSDCGVKVTFCNISDAENVLKKGDHTFSEVNLIVSAFHYCLSKEAYKQIEDKIVDTSYDEENKFDSCGSPSPSYETGISVMNDKAPSDESVDGNEKFEKEDGYPTPSTQLEDGLHCTIKVKIPKSFKLKDYYTLYFENLSVTPDEDSMILDGLNQCVYIRLSNSTEVEQVCQHKPDDDCISNIEMASPRELQFCPNMISIHGLDFKENKVRKKLQEMLKTILKCSPEIQAEEDTNSALIKFRNDDLNFISLATWKCAKKLDGVLLTTAPVPMGQSICVSGDCKDLKSLKLYFSNKKRSGGGPCEVAECKHGAKVTFENKADQERVINKQNHKLNDEELKVDHFYFCGIECRIEASRYTIKAKIKDVTEQKKNYIQYFKKLKVSSFDEKQMICDALDHSLYITFTRKQDVETICQLNRSELQKYNIVNVEKVSENSYFKEKISIHGIDFSASGIEEKLAEFFKQQIGFRHTKLYRGEEQPGGEPMSAIVEFDEEDVKGDIFTIAWQCAGQMEEKRIVTGPVPETSTVLISGDLAQLNSEVIKAYLSKPDNGGGPILNCENFEKDAFLLTFENIGDCECLMKKGEFDLSRQKLRPSIYHKCMSKRAYQDFIDSLHHTLKGTFSPQKTTLESSSIKKQTRTIGSYNLDGFDCNVLSRTTLQEECNKEHSLASVKFIEKNEILIEAESEEVLESLVKTVMKYIRNLTYTPIKLDIVKTNFLAEISGVEERINSNLKKKNIAAHLHKSNLYYHSASVQEPMNIIDKSVVIGQLKYSPNEISFLKSEKSKKFREGLEQKQCHLTFTSNENVSFCCFKENEKDCERQIKHYMLKESIGEKIISLPQEKVNFIKCFRHQDLERLNKERAVIEIQKEGIVLKGPKNFIESGEKCLEKLRNEIHFQEQQLKFDCIEEFLKNENGQKMLKSIGEKNKALLCLKGYNRSEDQPSNVQTPKLVGTLDVGNKKVNIYMGDFWALSVDAIVSPVNENLSLTITKAVFRNGGEELRNNYEQKNAQAIPSGSIMETDSGKLLCTKVFHIFFNPNIPADTQMSFLKMSLKNCLIKASEKGYTKLAVPLLGCEEFGWETFKAVQCMKQAVDDFLKEKSNISEVILCAENCKDALLLMEKFDAQVLEELRPKKKAKSAKEDTRNFGPVTVSVKDGNLLEEKCEAIASGIKEDMKLSNSGGVSKAILSKCGEALQTECSANASELAQEGAILTSAPNLCCSKIIHINMNKYSHNWHDGVTRVLQIAEANGLKSLALPAFGAGKKNADFKKVKEKVLRGIKKFAEEKPKSLCDIRLIITSPDLLKVFLSQGSSLDEEEDNMAASAKEDTRNFGPVTVSVKDGNLLEEKCEAIASGIKEDMKLSNSGGVSKAILSKCGEALQTECSANASELAQEGAILTSAPNLCCSKIIHINMNKYSHNWHDGVTRVLQIAEANGLKSLALPAFGAGKKNADFKKVKEKVLRGIKKFAEEKPKSLCDIRLIITSPDLLKVFLSQGSSLDEEEDNMAASDIQLSSESTVVVYSDSVESRQKTVKMLKEKLEKKYNNKAVNESPQFLNPSQKQDFINKGARQQIKVVMSNKINLSGFNKDGIAAMINEITQSIANARRKDLAENVPTLKIWKYESNDKWTNFSKLANHDIEAAFNRKEKQVTIIDDSGHQYIIDFTKMKKYSSMDGTKKDRELCTVERFDKRSGGYLPKKWDKMGEDEKLKIVEVKPGSKEFKEVEKNFKDAQANNPVKKVERIQNKALYQQYNARFTALKSDNPKGHENERRLFHGTDADTIPKINEGGFNRSYCGKNATAYGEGVYFAVNASYSENYAKADAQGDKKMFQARVLVGVSVQSTRGMKTLPLKPGTNTPYDSGQAKNDSTEMFIIFHDASVYPEYLITF